MSEKEPSRKESHVLLIKTRIRRLVYHVQDNEAHQRFTPGCCWWINAPDTVHFCEKMGVTEDEFKDAFY
jgi:hypothetical protein